MMDTIKVDSKKTRMVAHRGVSGIEKENTNSAFVAAGNRSYFGIETDVHVTIDDKFVLIHDDDTKRVAIDDISVERSTFDTLRSIVLTDKDGRKDRNDLKIPTLRDYVRICRKYGKTGVLELKNHMEPYQVQNIINEIVDEGYLEGIIFISFDMENLKVVRALLPDQKCQFLISKFPDDLIQTLVREKLDLDIYYKALSHEDFIRCKQAGLEVNVWTVDEKAEAEKFIEWGVDYITSNIVE